MDFFNNKKFQIIFFSLLKIYNELEVVIFNNYFIPKIRYDLCIVNYYKKKT